MTAATETKHSKPGEAEYPTTNQRKPVLIHREQELIMERLLLSPEEAAEVLGVGRSRIYDLMRKRELVSVRIGKCRRVPVAALKAYVERLTKDAFVA